MPARTYLPDRLIAVLVPVVAAVAAVAMFIAANADPDALWHGIYHDRNAHYATGQDLALAVRTADPAWFLKTLEAAKVWPPVHDLALAAVLLVGGIDHRLGIVPSLIGWAVTVVLVAAIARRMFADRDSGIAAAIVAAAFTIASPALRLLASDVMLECLGSALTAAAIWAYGRAIAAGPTVDPEAARRTWRVLAIILTVLFFEKGNYWGLTVASLAVAAVVTAPRFWLAWVRGLMQRIDARTVALVLRDPLVIAAVLVAALVVYLYTLGPTSIAVFGRPVRLYPPENLVTVAYAILFLRAALWWRSGRSAFDREVEPAGQALFYWHVVPVAASFLLPKRLSVFVWSTGPANAVPGTPFDPLGGIAVYWHGFADGFSVAPWMGAAALVLFVIALASVRKLSPGSGAVFALALVSFAGVVIHPQHQERFLGSWLFAVWIGAGAGAAILLERVLPARGRLATAGIVAAALLVAATRPYKPDAYQVAIHPSGGPSDLDFVRPVLSDLKGLRHIGYATTFGGTDLFRWTLREQCRCRFEVDDPWMSSLPGREAVRDAMAERVAGSHAAAFLIVDAPASPYELPTVGLTYDRMVGIVDAMAAQDRYIKAEAYRVASEGAEVSVWRLRQSATGPGR